MGLVGGNAAYGGLQRQKDTYLNETLGIPTILTRIP